MIPLRRLRRADAEALNRIYRRRGVLQVKLGERLLTLQFVSSPVAATAPVRAELELDGRKALLETEMAVADLLLDSVAPGLELSRLDPELGSMVLEMTIAPLLRSLEKASGRRLALMRLGGEVGANHVAIPLLVRPDHEGAPLPACLYVEPSTLPIMAAWAELLPLAPANADDVMLELVCRVGSVELATEELAALAPGDLIVMARTRLAQGEIDLVAERALVFSARITQTTAKLIGAGRWSVAEDDARASEAPVAASADLDSVPVTLVFEIGRLQLPLGELRTLAPGFNFDLGRDLRAPVDIVVGGRKIGTGELIQIDERLGVRVGKLFEQ